MRIGIRAGCVLSPTEERIDALVTIQDGRIERIDAFRRGLTEGLDAYIDALDQTLAPGFVDLQVNGALGYDFKSADPAQREAVYRFFLARGTTTFVPTLITDEPEMLAAGLARVAGDVERADPAWPNLPGIHLEGPFLHPDRKGAHQRELLRRPDLELTRRLWDAARGRIRLATLAPELEGGLALVRWFAEQGAVVSAGHTTATREILLRACDEGLTMLTHMGNVSDWPHRRKGAAGIFVPEPGAVGTFMVSDRLRGSLILDGYHFDPPLAAALARLRGTQNVALISDASYATGCPPGVYTKGAMMTTVHPDGYAYATEGTGYLAGSVITMQEAVGVAVRQGAIPLREAVEMATLTPARILGLDERIGRIAPGCAADLVLLDAALNVTRVFRAGQEVREAVARGAC